MRNTNPTAGVSDILRLVWARVGNVHKQARPAANVPMLARMRDAALQVATEALALAEQLSVLIAACADTRCEHCGKPVTVQATGAPRKYCREECGRLARMDRMSSYSVSRETVEIGG